jgi:hypothetical protein
MCTQHTFQPRGKSYVKTVYKYNIKPNKLIYIQWCSPYIYVILISIATYYYIIYQGLVSRLLRVPMLISVVSNLSCLLVDNLILPLPVELLCFSEFPTTETMVGSPCWHFLFRKSRKNPWNGARLSRRKVLILCWVPVAGAGIVP